MREQRPTMEEIEAARTPNGGWTRSQLAEWGVSWPPPKGWKKQFSGHVRDTLATSAAPAPGRNRPGAGESVEAPTGIEPVYTALQAPQEDPDAL